MEKIINFDMDGTLADFYNVENWLNKILNEDASPYGEAKPKVNTNLIDSLLETLQEQGYEINIISWGCKGGSKEFLKTVEKVKKEWLNTYFKTKFDNIFIVDYGTPKESIKKGILFDDEYKNRCAWNGVAFNEECIECVLFDLVMR